jgi:hypothetical protein
MSVATHARKGESAGPSKASASSKTAAGGLHVGEAKSAFDQEADRVTDEIVAGAMPRRHWSLDKVSIETPSTQRQAEDGLITIDRAASNLQREQGRRAAEIRANGPVRFRVPTAADMKALFTTHSVPESVLKDRVQLALTRMAEEKRLKTADSVPDLMKKIFPAAGVFDEAAYESAVDLTDRTKIYESVLDARSKVSSVDKPKLKTVMADTAELIGKCAKDEINLKSVFGSKHARAKDVYVMAKVALTTAMNHLDTAVDTDYNFDDPETGLGGWATYYNQHIHLKQKVAQVTNVNDAKITIVHESCHLANPSVSDDGDYYGLNGFEGATEEVKVANAAHYEEIPRRLLALSDYKDPHKAGSFLDFKPGSSAAGAPLNFEQRVKSRSDEYLRKAWDKASDVHGFIRDIRKEELAGSGTGFKTHKKRVLELSRLMHLTVHEQPAAPASVNQVDVVLAEGIAHAAGKAYGAGQDAKVPDPLALKAPERESFRARRPSVIEQRLDLKPTPGLGPPTDAPIIVTEDVAVGKVIDDSIKAAGTITGDFADDKKLMDWLAAEYKKEL